MRPLFIIYHHTYLVTMSTHPLFLDHQGWLYGDSGGHCICADTEKGPEATLKKNVVSGPAAGCVYNCRMGTFFSHFAPKKFGVKISSFSYQKKKGGKKKDFAAARLATISATRWTEKLFFKGGLRGPLIDNCKRIYFRAAKFSGTEP